jgi:hypothetical protein
MLANKHKEEKLMKVGFENAVAYYSGKYDEIVYQEWFKGKLCFARKYAYPELVKVHEDMRAIGLNLSLLYNLADPLYISDMKAYAKKNYTQNRTSIKRLMHKMPSSKALFVSCMWQWYKSDPVHVDLKTVTLDDIITLDSPVKTVKKCVEANYLRRVTGYEAYTNLIKTAP